MPGELKSPPLQAQVWAGSRWADLAVIIVPIFHILYKDPWKSAVTVKCGNGQLSCFVPLDSSQDTVTSGVQTVIIFLMAQAKLSIK